jgi:hypothetical protein
LESREPIDLSSMGLFFSGTCAFLAFMVVKFYLDQQPLRMTFKHHVPILYSTDVTRSIAYYTDVLGFEQKWEWGTPPTFGGVRKDHVEIFFCKDGQGNPGTWLAIFIQNVDEYHDSDIHPERR